MRKHKIARLLFLAPFILAFFIFGFGWAVQHLWNWLMPVIFGLPTIGFGQAWGLMGLSWILLGGLRGFGGSARHSRGISRGRWERWREMTPEQRAAVREAMGWRLDRPPADPAGGQETL